MRRRTDGDGLHITVKGPLPERVPSRAQQSQCSARPSLSNHHSALGEGDGPDPVLDVGVERRAHPARSAGPQCHQVAVCLPLMVAKPPPA